MSDRHGMWQALVLAQDKLSNEPGVNFFIENKHIELNYAEQNLKFLHSPKIILSVWI
jgi:hypothetical protein